MAQGVYVYQFMIDLRHLVAKAGGLTDTDIERYGLIAALSYGPAYVDEVGILCDLNGAIWSAGRLRARTA